MKGFKDQDFTRRLSASNSSRQTALDKLKAKLDPNDPAAVERRAQRLAVAQARDARIAARKAEKEAEERRVEEERVAKQVAEQAEREARKQRESKELEELLRAQKAARDARYAARKARSKK